MRIVFFGLPPYGTAYLKALLKKKENVVAVVTSPKDPYFEEIVKLAKTHNIPFYLPLKLTNPEFINTLQSFAKPDLIIAAHFDKLFPAQILAIPAKGCINIHPSFLPNYRGSLPYFWPIINNESKTGISIHFMDQRFDTGDIIKQTEVEIKPDDNFANLAQRLTDKGVKLLLEVLALFTQGKKVPRTPQKPGKFPKAPKVMLADLKINWGNSSQEIYNLIRAANPYFGARTTFRGKALTIWSAKINQGKETKKATPGTICFSKNGALLIKTGAGAVLPEVISYEGIKPAEKFISDHNVQENELLS